jgi:hypothetical protein
MPPNNKQINIDQIPKQFSERTVVGSNNQFFVLMPVVGTNATAFALTPEHAKSLSKVLSERVEKFEKTVRTIPDPKGAVLSPIQTTDLPPNDGDNDPEKK